MGRPPIQSYPSFMTRSTTFRAILARIFHRRFDSGDLVPKIGGTEQAARRFFVR
jgi:hypothetical protein